MDPSKSVSGLVLGDVTLHYLDRDPVLNELFLAEMPAKKSPIIDIRLRFN
jgi:hypothetical protein